MRTIIEEALKLPKEEKIKLYHALQEDLEFNDNVLHEDELTYKPRSEVKQRMRDMENNKNVISLEEHIDFIKRFGQ